MDSQVRPWRVRFLPLAKSTVVCLSRAISFSLGNNNAASVKRCGYHNVRTQTDDNNSTLVAINVFRFSSLTHVSNRLGHVRHNWSYGTLCYGDFWRLPVHTDSKLSGALGACLASMGQQRQGPSPRATVSGGIVPQRLAIPLERQDRFSSCYSMGCDSAPYSPTQQ
jgi:hypothetical protein